MRFSLKLQNKYPNNICILPVDYQYYLSSAVYDILNTGDKPFTEFLHDTGYIFESKTFKFFDFSSLRGKLQFQEPDRLILTNKYLYFTISFFIPEISETFIRGLFNNRNIWIGDKFTTAHFTVKSMEREPKPEFTETMNYFTTSPVLIAQKSDDRKHATYLSPEDENYKEIFFKNLQDKYNAFLAIEKKPIHEFDLTSCSLETCSEPKSKLITIKEGTKEQTKVRAWNYKMRITAPLDLQKTAYYAGAGKSNAEGFGLLEIDKN